jgi:hypothetical protein
MERNKTLRDKIITSVSNVCTQVGWSKSFRNHKKRDLYYSRDNKISEITIGWKVINIRKTRNAYNILKKHLEVYLKDRGDGKIQFWINACRMVRYFISSVETPGSATTALIKYIF